MTTFVVVSVNLQLYKMLNLAVCFEVLDHLQNWKIQYWHDMVLYIENQ